VRWRVPRPQLAVLAILAGVPGLAFLALLPAGRIAAPVVLAAVGATAISGVQGPPGPRSLGSRIGWSGLAFVMLASATVLRSTTWFLLPTLSSLRALQDALVHGVVRLLSSAEPAPAVPSSLVLPVAITWIVAFAGVEVAARRKAALAPMIPAVVAYGAVLLIGGRDGHLVLPAVLIAAGALLGVLRSARGVGVGLAVAAVVAISAAAAASVVAVGTHPFDLHDHVGPAPIEGPEISPLARMQGRLLDKANPVMFQVHVPDGEVDRAPNWRLAELDQFDGSQWSASGVALPGGSDLPRSSPSATVPAGRPLHQDVTLQALDGSWLPAAARPSHISLPSVDVRPAAGTLGLPDGVHPDLTYTVVSQVPQLQTTDLQDVAIDASAQPGADELAPGSPAAVDAISRLAAQVADGHDSSPFRTLTALQAYLRSAPFAYQPAAPSGQAYAQVADFLGRTHVGSAEQFAGAFCLMARAQHLPCRVAVGFRRGTAASGTFTVHSTDAYAWPEVPFKGYGWVPFDPTPRGGNAVAPTVADLAAPDTSSDTPTPAPDASGAQTGGTGGSSAASTASSDTAGADLAVEVAAGVLALLLLGPLAIVALKARRRRRRAAAPTPRARVLGAWQQVADDLARPAAGEPLTVAEVVDASTVRHGAALGAPMAELGSLTNLALFDRRGPTDQQSALAWSCAREAARIAASGRTRRSRLLRHIDPRPLWSARHRRNRTR